MPIFLQESDIYRIIQRELPPDDVYPDGPATAFYSTADSFATAQVIRDAYESQQNIYENYFPNIAEDRLADFEFTYFGYFLDSALSVAERRARLLTQIRTLRRTTPQDMKDVVHTIISDSVVVEIIEWGNFSGGWFLDESQLDIETFLNGYSLLNATGEEAGCSDGSDYGIDAETWLLMREDAYTYEVRIYDYTLSSTERSQIDAALKKAEPARSRHIITDGLDGADTIDGEE
jgi:hypothetical protein